MNVLRRAFTAIRTCKNWPDIVLSMLSGQEPTTVTLRNGIRIEAPEHSTLLEMIQEVFLRQVYNPANLPIEGHDLVVDIGANIGVFTLFAAHHTRNNVYAFEPFAGNVEFLAKNIRNNKLQNIDTQCIAVSDKLGSARLYLSDISGGHLLFDHNVKGKLEKYVQVQTTTLKAVMDANGLDQIDFLKIDSEGSEGAILSSTPLEYLKRIRKIAMEFHDNVSSPKHDGLRKLLEDAGFVTELNWNSKSPFGYLYGRMV